MCPVSTKVACAKQAAVPQDCSDVHHHVNHNKLSRSSMLAHHLGPRPGALLTFINFFARWMTCKTWPASMLTQSRRTASCTMRSRTSRATFVCSAESGPLAPLGTRILAVWTLVLMERYTCLAPTSCVHRTQSLVNGEGVRPW